MPKLTLTDKEKVNLELYINFLVHSSNPCDGCSMTWQCCGCLRKDAYQKKLKKYGVEDLLKYEEIDEYVTSSVKLNKCRAQILSLTEDVRNLEKKISEIMDSIDLVKDSEKKINDMTEFYCKNCKTRFAVPNDKCKIAFDGLEGTVQKYYTCPKCTKICWCNND